MTNGWPVKKLGDLTESISTGPFGTMLHKSDYVVDGIPLINPVNIVDGRIVPSEKMMISNETRKRLSNYVLRPGDVVVGRRGELGRCAIVSDVEDGWLCGTGSCFIRLSKQVDERFFALLFRSNQIRSLLEAASVGTTMSNLNHGILNNLPIPVPPLAEQQRIVGILDEAFEGIATAKANAEKNLQNAHALFESHLQSVFTQRGMGWVETTLGEVCEFIGGSQPPKSVFSKTKKADNIRLIQIRDYKSDNHVVYIPRELARRFCNADDVMIGRYGPPLFQILRGLDGAYNVALMKAVPDEAMLSHDFLFYFLKHSTILEYVIYHSSRAAGQIGVTKETLEPYPMALPSRADQKQIVQTIMELEAETQRLATIFERKLAALENLKKSLLHQAFLGQL